MCFEIICHAIAFSLTSSACFSMLLTFDNKNKQIKEKRAQFRYYSSEHLFDFIWIIHIACGRSEQTIRATVFTGACKERGSKCFIVCHLPITYVAIYLDKKQMCIMLSLSLKHAIFSCDSPFTLLVHLIRFWYRNSIRTQIIHLIKFNLWLVVATL